jgi:hypothetical protein
VHHIPFGSRILFDMPTPLAAFDRHLRDWHSAPEDGLDTSICLEGPPAALTSHTLVSNTPPPYPVWVAQVLRRRLADPVPELDMSAASGPFMDAVVVGPFMDAVVVGPFTDAIVVGPFMDAVVVGPFMDAVVVGPFMDAAPGLFQ